MDKMVARVLLLCLVATWMSMTYGAVLRFGDGKEDKDAGNIIQRDDHVSNVKVDALLNADKGEVKDDDVNKQSEDTTEAKKEEGNVDEKNEEGNRDEKNEEGNRDEKNEEGNKDEKKEEDKKDKKNNFEKLVDQGMKDMQEAMNKAEDFATSSFESIEYKFEPGLKGVGGQKGGGKDGKEEKDKNVKENKQQDDDNKKIEDEAKDVGKELEEQAKKDLKGAMTGMKKVMNGMFSTMDAFSSKVEKSMEDFGGKPGDKKEDKKKDDDDKDVTKDVVEQTIEQGKKITDLKEHLAVGNLPTVTLGPKGRNVVIERDIKRDAGDEDQGKDDDEDDDDDDDDDDDGNDDDDDDSLAKHALKHVEGVLENASDLAKKIIGNAKDGGKSSQT